MKGQGYIWMSDKTQPEIISELNIDDYKKTPSNPFVNECMFSTETTSYIIRFVDGQYIISEASFSVPEGAIDKPVEYCAHRLEGIAKIKLVQRWELRENTNCLDMKEYVPTQLVFKGFEPTKAEEK